MTITIVAKNEPREIITRYGGLSRGSCWGRWYAGQTRATGDFEWCEKDGGALIVPSGPGFLVYGSKDGFRRSESESKVFA